MSSDGGLERQEAGQVTKHVRLHAPPPPGRLTADRSAGGRDQGKKTESKYLHQKEITFHTINKK